MKNFLSFVFFASFSSLIFFSCSDEPSAVGLNVLPKNDTLKIDSVIAFGTSDTIFLHPMSGSSTRLLTGHYQYLQARTLLQFRSFSLIPANAIVDSATLSMNVDYRFQNSSGLLGFEVHKMLRTWKEQTFTWDTSNVPGTFRSTPDTTFLKMMTDQDTVVSLRLDKLVKEWIQSGVDAPEGLILIPDTITTNIILGVRNDAISTAPSLSIAYHTPGDTTVTLRLIPVQSTSVANGTPPSSSTERYLQAGVSYRELLRFDSIATSVPLRGTILQAVMEIATDTSSSLLNSVSTDSILVYFLRTNAAPYADIVLGTLCTPAYNGTQKVFRADIKNIVQQWVTRGPNYGIVIRTYNEFTSLDRIALYGSGAAPALRPKLKIVYSILP